MLKLKGIKKDYVAGNETVHALKGIDITFRDNEFVSILGPSGCGKTTLLNIIGGLDHYTSGDLFIDDVSTKKFTDRDWDTYRNHRIGFVFQSYNLIPHQTILSNVELALTIGGVDKKERTQRAKEALDKVGLKGQYHKKPNQLSGGQCQRVAIARALVNEPEILLADEPTGALDSTTSVQIMELIKDIAKDRLVIMVTHNPELAEQYSTRIVKLFDGLILNDSNPYDGEVAAVPAKPKKSVSKKSKLSFWTAFKLSAKNLHSKFKRTLMVCIAGSIGIIGIATVLALSSGIQGYIASMQDDMLSGNPITISETTLDLNALTSQAGNRTRFDAVKDATEDGYIDVNSMIEFLVSRSESLSSIRVTNDITQSYIDYLNAMPQEYYAAIDYDYSLDVTNNIYTDYTFSSANGEKTSTMSLSAALEVFTAMLNQTEFAQYSSFITTLTDSFAQAPDNVDFILSQYDFLTSPESSKVATEADEIMIVVNSEKELTDLLFAQLGYYTQDEFFNLVYKATDDARYDASLDKTRFSYDELLGKTFTWYPNNTVYSKTPESSPFAAIQPFTYNAYADNSWTTGKTLKITAILVQKEDISYGCLDSGFYYTSAFTKEMLSSGLDSEIVKYLNDNEQDSFNSAAYQGMDIGITYKYSFYFNGEEFNDVTGYVGSISQMSAILGSIAGEGQEIPTYYTLSLRDLGGCSLPNAISIYSADFNQKDNVTDYLDAWNSDGDIVVNGITITADERAHIVYNDTLSIIISMINGVINMITAALVAFTALSLVVSTVMIAIITYVSVMERVKEIGVIRSLGGRKRDVSSLFIAETFIIGTISGVIGIGITYLLSLIINLIVGSIAGISSIAALPFTTALIMIAVSIVLTLISGVVPARSAAKKDPVEALRTE